jgi:hypothetical protein
MKRGTQEFYDMRAQFEKDVGPMIYGHKFDLVSKEDAQHVPTTQFYNDGVVNQLFHAYMLGYANARCIYQP